MSPLPLCSIPSQSWLSNISVELRDCILNFFLDSFFFFFMCSCVTICFLGGKNPWSQKRASDPLGVVMSCTMWVVEQDVLFTVRPSLPPPYPHFLLQGGKALGHMDWHYWVISEDCYLQQLSCLLASSTLVAFGVNGPAHQMTTLALTHQMTLVSLSLCSSARAAPASESEPGVGRPGALSSGSSLSPTYMK